MQHTFRCHHASPDDDAVGAGLWAFTERLGISNLRTNAEDDCRRQLGNSTGDRRGQQLGVVGSGQVFNGVIHVAHRSHRRSIDEAISHASADTVGCGCSDDKENDDR